MSLTSFKSIICKLSKHFLFYFLVSYCLYEWYIFWTGACYLYNKWYVLYSFSFSELTFDSSETRLLFIHRTMFKKQNVNVVWPMTKKNNYPFFYLSGLSDYSNYHHESNRLIRFRIDCYNFDYCIDYVTRF